MSDPTPDPTLTAPPHVTAIVSGLFASLLLRLGLNSADASELANWLVPLLGVGVTSLVHYLQARNNEKKLSP